ncbi:ROK family transcriptional regulator [Microbacterium sp. H1-D42]|uniref:ROK family transcriptional regulator n=1 Tax=Microbacterium sp. H1-D42 TaxID=2925844 RepID=UPI001F52D893|nr:ROK family transcriptional regulator [Microbacterium sp. H1-D42]UNK71351.1 ROK family transcriptional regulator [Microbacterium sp. H1-D42]
MARPPARTPSTLRTPNAKAILEALARRGPLTRAQLMHQTGLSRGAVAPSLRSLESRDLIVSAGTASPSGEHAAKGPAAMRVALNPRLGFAVAVHLDHHDAHVALVDATGAVRAEAHAPLSAAYDRLDVITALIEECTGGVAPLHAAVVAAPGIVTRDGEIRDDSGPDGGAFRAALAERVGCPVRIENDVSLAALAELAGELGTQHSSFALLLLDGGLGAAFVLDGVLRRGASGMAGEVQYLPQTPLPLGAPVVGEVVTADLASGVGRDPSLPLLAHLEAAATGDPAAHSMISEIARRLTVVAGTVSLVIDPGIFVLAGLAAHPVMFDAIQHAAQAWEERLPLRFTTSAFGREAPLVGAVHEATVELQAALFSPDDRKH